MLLTHHPYKDLLATGSQDLTQFDLVNKTMETFCFFILLQNSFLKQSFKTSNFYLKQKAASRLIMQKQAMYQQYFKSHLMNIPSFNCLCSARLLKVCEARFSKDFLPGAHGSGCVRQP